MALKDFLEEASIMKEMKHPNLVQLLGQNYPNNLWVQQYFIRWFFIYFIFRLQVYVHENHLFI